MNQACKLCGERHPVSHYVKHDKRRAKPYVSAICRSCRLRRQRETRPLRETPKAPPRVTKLPHYETMPETNALWPKNRLFHKWVFLDDLAEGTWPDGLMVKDEKGTQFRVEQTELRRIR